MPRFVVDTMRYSYSSFLNEGLVACDEEAAKLLIRMAFDLSWIGYVYGESLTLMMRKPVLLSV